MAYDIEKDVENVAKALYKNAIHPYYITWEQETYKAAYLAEARTALLASSAVKELTALQERYDVLVCVVNSHKKTCEAFGKAPDVGIEKISINDFLTPPKKD